MKKILIAAAAVLVALSVATAAWAVTHLSAVSNKWVAYVPTAVDGGPPPVVTGGYLNVCKIEAVYTQLDSYAAVTFAVAAGQVYQLAPSAGGEVAVTAQADKNCR